MFKVSFYIRKKPEVSSERFRDYWLNDHAEMQKTYLENIGVRAFIKCEVLPNDPFGQATTEAYGTKGEFYDFVDHWVFNDIEDLRKGVANFDNQTAMHDVHISECAYVDFARSSVGMSVDLAQFYPVEDHRASLDNAIVKLIYCVRILPGLTRDQAQLHWNACHGAVSRQDIGYSVLSKYVQAHNIDSTFVDDLTKLNGYDPDPNLVGHAEAWLDTSAPPKDFPEEEAAEIVAMSMEDIDYFADKNVSQVFATKEHFVIDERVITRPMPKFFSAVY